ncbi:hypothetical protein G7Y89_g14639 [Cudoniella acicularis]|uniref:Major facilitator superfamily (MFS) profile domain-containing protein n=1 Tax=Cudoniella acicularis TaxID=354080 RepID=A0A8H4R1M9_9HELO|nr:hypothetical protein G7Y89_g14639 [Cudoniella acicularis]
MERLLFPESVVTVTAHGAFKWLGDTEIEQPVAHPRVPLVAQAGFGANFTAPALRPSISCFQANDLQSSFSQVIRPIRKPQPRVPRSIAAPKQGDVKHRKCGKTGFAESPFHMRHMLTTLDPEVTVKSLEVSIGSSPPCPASIDEKALVRRIDLRLIPMLFIIYIAAFLIDKLARVNISNALTMSLPKDLKLVGVERNVALTIFFVPYIIFEVPSNILMKKFRPHIWLSECILEFEIVTLAQGFVTTYGGLLGTRFFLGLVEAGIFPGSFYQISLWYRRDEAQQRFTLYWRSVLIASGIAHKDGIRGIHNWQWMFILEGIATVLVGMAAFFLVSDFPEDAAWLTAEERTFVIARAESRAGAGTRGSQDTHSTITRCDIPF